MRNATLALLLLLAAGCQQQMPLMPTPEALRDPDFNLFEANPEPLTTNRITTLYATTRAPASGGSSFYTGRKDSQLRFGTAEVMIGDENVPLSELIDQSTSGDRTERIMISVQNAPTFGSVPLSATSGELDQWAQELDGVNELLRRKPIKELTIFVHGASNTFPVSLERGSQFQYFSGNNAAVLTFAWPSPGHIFGYFADKRRSGAAASDLALVIELLAEHSIAERINLLAYSAGGRTVARALELLGARYHDPSTLRLGQIYLSQSDQPASEFLEGLPSYFDLIEAINVTMVQGDRVLQLAAATDLKVRLGSMREGQQMNLSPEAIERLEEIMRSERMVFIDLKDVAAEDYRFSHGAWYESSWVSTDVMIALLGGQTPEDRGLESREVPGAIVWRFPPEYLEALRADIQTWRQEQDAQAELEAAANPEAASN